MAALGWVLTTDGVDRFLARLDFGPWAEDGATQTLKSCL